MLPVEKDLLTRLMNSLSMLVLTFLLYGGLNHITFLCHLRFDGTCGGGLNSSLCIYPLFLSASWYRGTALLKMSSLAGMLDSHRLIASSMFSRIFAGWFNWL